MNEIFNFLATFSSSHTVFWTDTDSGLQAILVVDDMTLGPAAGGVRVQPYPSVRAAITEAASLASAMTKKAALAGVACGGCKIVVVDHARLDREKAFEVLGRRLQELGGAVRTGADLGTTAEDLAAMAKYTEFVHTDSDAFAAAVARGLHRCMEACAKTRGTKLAGLHIAIQGCGAIGTAVAHRLHAAGCQLSLADIDVPRAEDLAFNLGAALVPADEILDVDCDILAPCAVGGVVTTPVAQSLKAWALCGAANNILAEEQVAEVLKARGILHVPDVIASAGALCEGIGESVMGLADRTGLIDGLGETAFSVLAEAKTTDRTPTAVAFERAAGRLLVVG